MIQNMSALVDSLTANEIYTDTVAVRFKDGVVTDIPYAEFVGTLAKDMGTDTLDLLHAAVGVSGEAGELLDAIKKLWAYEKPMTEAVMENIVEELGDLEFYMQLLRLKLGLQREYILEKNADKLGKRYADGYSNAAALARADKAPGE